MKVKFDKILGRIREGDRATPPTGFATWEDYFNWLIENRNLNPDSTRLIDGSYYWIENLDFQFEPLIYEILGQRVQSVAQKVTIPANVSADPMFALIYGDIFGNLGYILGTPAPDPAIPLVGPATQIALVPVYIDGLGTQPATPPATEIIYDENVEWATAKTEETGLTINLADTTNPAANLKNIKIAFAGAAGGAWISQNQVVSSFTAHTEINIPVETNLVDIPVSALSAQHKTDTIIGTTRRLSWLNWMKLNQVKITLTDLIDPNNVYRLNPQTGYPTENFTVAALGFSVVVPQTLSGSYNGNIPAGDYQLIVENLTTYDQYFTQAAAETFAPTAAKIAFTRTAPIDVTGGNIKLSMFGSADWLANTALLFELWNGTAQVGSLTILPGNLRGFNPALAQHQQIILSVADFHPTSNVITALTIRPLNSWPNNSDFYIDNIVLQAAITQPATQIIEDMTFDYRDAALNNVYEIDPLASYGYKILSLVIKTDADTATAEVKINAAQVTGLAAVAATNVNQVIEATGANIVQPGDVVKITLTGIGTATAINGKIRLIRT